MKKLLKSGICGSMNSARVHCSWLTWSNSAAGGKKENQKTQSRIQRKMLNPNGHIMCKTSLYINITQKGFLNVMGVEEGDLEVGQAKKLYEFEHGIDMVLCW